MRANPIKRAIRRDNSLDRLAADDGLTMVVGHYLIRICAESEAGAPAVNTIANYYLRKTREVRAAYFRQRYGRDYFTGQPRHNRERKTLWKLADLDSLRPDLLLEYRYGDGTAWGCGTPAEAKRDAAYSNTVDADLRYVVLK